MDGRELLASAGNDATVRIWDPATGLLVIAIPVPAIGLSVSLAGDSQLLIGTGNGLLAIQVTVRRTSGRY